MFTVVVPHFNHARHLPRALAATAEAAECIVVDDGSEPAAAAEARKAAVEAGARFLALDGNRGPAAARNLGADRASQPYLVFLDADDALVPGFGEAVRAFLAQNPNVDGLHPAVRYEGLPADLADAFDEARRRNSDMVTASGLVVRRDVFSAMGGFPEDPVFLGRAGGEDVAFVNALSRLADYRYWGRTLVVAQAGGHLIDYLRRTRVEDGKVVFTENTPEEQSGALSQAIQAYLDRAAAGLAAARDRHPSALASSRAAQHPSGAHSIVPRIG